LGRSLIRGLAIAALLLVVSQTLIVPIRATGISMLPTYSEGQLLLLNALATASPFQPAATLSRSRSTRTTSSS
jgi:signal peptidase I